MDRIFSIQGASHVFFSLDHLEKQKEKPANNIVPKLISFVLF